MKWFYFSCELILLANGATPTTKNLFFQRLGLLSCFEVFRQKLAFLEIESEHTSCFDQCVQFIFVHLFIVDFVKKDDLYELVITLEHSVDWVVIDSLWWVPRMTNLYFCWFISTLDWLFDKGFWNFPLRHLAFLSIRNRISCFIQLFRCFIELRSAFWFNHLHSWRCLGLSIGAFLILTVVALLLSRLCLLSAHW